MATAKDPEWIPVARALQITGHESLKALDSYCRRMGRRFPDAPIARRTGYVEKGSLIRALELDAEAHDKSKSTRRIASNVVRRIVAGGRA